MPNNVEQEVGSARAWHIAGRWQEYAGEMRVALLRSLLVLVFYAVQLGNHLFVAEPNAGERIFHRQATGTAAVWLFVSLIVIVCLKGRYLPAYLKYLVTTVDLVLVTLLAWLGPGPQSPLVGAFFVVLALAALRFRVGLVWFATLMSTCGYMFLVATVDKKWFDADHTTPIIEQAITVCALVSTGLVLDQTVRAAKCMADEYCKRNLSAGKEVSP